MTLLDLENSLRAAAGLCVVTGPETAAAVLALQQQQMMIAATAALQQQQQLHQQRIMAQAALQQQQQLHQQRMAQETRPMMEEKASKIEIKPCEQKRPRGRRGGWRVNGRKNQDQQPQTSVDKRISEAWALIHMPSFYLEPCQQQKADEIANRVIEAYKSWKPADPDNSGNLDRVFQQARVNFLELKEERVRLRKKRVRFSEEQI